MSKSESEIIEFLGVAWLPMLCIVLCLMVLGLSLQYNHLVEEYNELLLESENNSYASFPPLQTCGAAQNTPKINISLFLGDNYG